MSRRYAIDRWREEQGRLYWLNDRIPTCRMAWQDASPSEVFESQAVPENKGMAQAPVGAQRGTYFKTSKYHADPAICPEPMPVWRWGGRDKDDLAAGRCDGVL